MSPQAVVLGCLAVAAVGIALGVLVEWLDERAQRRRRQKRGGYLHVGPSGRKRLP